MGDASSTAGGQRLTAVAMGDLCRGMGRPLLAGSMWASIRAIDVPRSRVQPRTIRWYWHPMTYRTAIALRSVYWPPRRCSAGMLRLRRCSCFQDAVPGRCTASWIPTTATTTVTSHLHSSGWPSLSTSEPLPAVSATWRTPAPPWPSRCRACRACRAQHTAVGAWSTMTPTPCWRSRLRPQSPRVADRVGACEDAARVPVDVGRATEANALLAEALACCEDIDARAWAAGTGVALRRLGVHRGTRGPRRRPASGWESLTAGSCTASPGTHERCSNQPGGSAPHRPHGMSMVRARVVLWVVACGAAPTPPTSRKPPRQRGPF